MGLRDYTRIYLDGQEIGTAYRGAVQILGGAPTVPGQIPDTAWAALTGTAPGEVIVTLSAQPASGGTPVTGFVYRIDDGEVRPLGPGLGLHGLSGLAPGAEISIRIAAVNGVGQGPWSAAKTVTVKAETIAPPVALTDPAVTGALSQGATLTASEGVWSGSPALTVQWLRNGVAIAGATGTSHVLTAADSGAMLSVMVTATNAGGTVAALSPAVGPVEAAVTYEFETDIVILAYGQSNEQAQNNSGGQPYLSSDQDSTGRICRWDATSGAAVAAGQPMTGWPQFTQMGPARSYRLAQELLARQNPEKKIIIVNCAVAGARLSGATLGVGGTHYNTMISRMTACLAAYPEAQVLMSFTQGEADGVAGVSEATYTTAVTNVVNNIKALSPNAAQMRSFIHQMVPERLFGPTADQPTWLPEDLSHKKFALSIPDTIFVGASFGTQIAGDLSHFTAAGHRNAGNRAAAWLTRIAMWQTSVPAVPAAPVVVSDDTIRITVADPQPPAYVIEYRAAGSSGAWTEQIAFPEIWLDAPGTFDVTVAGGGNREVRLKARSRAGTSAAGASVTVAEAPADGGWSITAGDASAVITSAPASPATPVIASVGDTTATITA